MICAARARTFIMISFRPFSREHGVNLTENVLRPRPSRLTATTPRSHGFATFSCPTEMSPIEQLVTQVTPQLLRRQFASSGPGLPLSLRPSHCGGILNPKPATRRLTRTIEKKKKKVTLLMHDSCPLPVQEACCTQSFTVDLINMSAGTLFYFDALICSGGTVASIDMSWRASLSSIRSETLVSVQIVACFKKIW